MPKKLLLVLLFLCLLRFSFSSDDKEIVFFYTPCLKCREIEKKILPKIPKECSIIYADAAEEKVFTKLLSLSEKHNIMPPAVLFNGKLYDYVEIKSLLLKDILVCKPGNPNKTSSLSDSSGFEVLRLFKSFSFFVIFIAGLTDGINPCAFVTLLFFLTYISSVKRETHLKHTGFYFILAVFITYFITGISGYKIIKLIQETGFYYLFSYLVLGITAIIFFLSLFDVFENTKNQKNDFFLKIPDLFQKFIHKTIRVLINKSMNNNSFLLYFFSFLTGCIISLIELFCTGQIYLPVLKIIFEQEQGLLKLKSLFLIFIYNFAFIFPLIILLMAYIMFEKLPVFSFVKKNIKFARMFISLILFILFLTQILYL